MPSTPPDSTAPEPALRASLVAGVMMWAMAQGVPRDALDRALALPADVDVWSSAGGWVPYDNVAALWRMLEARLPDRALGVEMGQAMPFQHLGVLAYASRSAPSGRAVVELWQRYMAVISTGRRVVLDGDTVWFSVRWHAVPRSVHEVTMTLSHREIAEIFGRGAVVSVCVPHRDTWTRPLYAAAIGADVEFVYGADRLGLRFDPVVLDRPSPFASRRLHATLVEHLGQLLADVDQAVGTLDPVADVRAAVARLAEDGIYGVDALVDATGVARRTLQRWVKAEGYTLKALIDERREHNAHQLLSRTTLSTDDVAFLLGFAEERSFTRAFKRWTGKTPAAWRRAAQAG